MTGAGGKRVFVVGVGRSGTSLLQSMINAHGEVCFPPETGAFRSWVGRGELVRADGPEALTARLAADAKIGRLGLDGRELREAVDAALARPDFAVALYERLLAAYVARQGGATWTGDKDPRLVEYLPVVRRVYPDARILHIVRDPRDVLASKMKAEWSANRLVARHVFATRVQLAIGRREGPRLFGPRYMELKYEELIARPEPVLRGVCDHLGVAFDPRMLEFAESSRALVAEDEMQWKKETLGPLLSGNRGKWRSSLTPWQAALTERVCREAFDACGYERSDSAAGLSTCRRTALVAAPVAFAALEWVYRCCRRWKLR